jgi:tetratricopeptide (TPR) repeat protein
MKRNEQKGIIENEVGELGMGQNKAKIFISNKTNEIEKNDKNSGNGHKSHIKSTSIQIQSTPKSVNNEAENIPKKVHSTDNGVEVIKINLMQYFKETAEERANILYNFLQNKFIPRDSLSDAKKNFFNQLIQIRPPEGINATAASPLIDSNKGWAPSIPSLQVSKMKTNLNDLLMRAKGGIQAGDIPKEAHMAFYLGIMNEEEKKYEEALKFYKKFFLSAKLLQDVYGTELALNRIAVLYSNIIDYNQSLYYNEKHKDITTHNVNGFVAFYNCGVCQRILGKIEDSLKSFTRALQMAEEENVKFFLK